MAIRTVHDVISASLQGSITGRHLAKASDATLWCVFSDKPAGYSNYQLYCAYSSNNGATWTEEQITSTDIYHYAVTCAIDSNDVLHIAYMGSGRSPYTSRANIFYNQRDPADGWGDEEVVSEVNANQELPVIAVDSINDIHVAWSGDGWGVNTSDQQIVYRKRLSGTWQTSEPLTDSTKDQGHPDIALSPVGFIHIVWENTIGPSVYTSIYHIYKVGSSWSTAETVNTDVDGYHQFPSVAVDSRGFIHVAWAGIETVDGELEDYANIRYTRGYPDKAWHTRENVTSSDRAQGGLYLAMALDKEDNPTVIWSGLGWGTNTDNYNLQARTRSGVTWQTQVAVTDTANDYIGGSAMWAMFPEDTNIPDSGYTFVAEKEGISVIYVAPIDMDAYIWVEGNFLHWIAYDERRILGSLTGNTGVAGHIWVEGNNVHYIDSSGKERWQLFRLSGATGVGVSDGSPMWVEKLNLHIIDSSGRERYGGVWVVGVSRVGVDMKPYTVS